MMLRRVRMLLLAVMALLACACTRDPFSIGDVGLYPAVVASHRPDAGFSMISEGFSIVLFSDDFTSDSPYQVSITSPDASSRWEFFVSPSVIADVPALVKTDLLLPQDAKMESGDYLVEVYLPDGRRVSRTYAYRRKAVIDELLLRCASYHMPQWERTEQGQWYLWGIAESSGAVWDYTLADKEGRTLLRLSSDDEMIMDGRFADEQLRDEVTHVIARQHDHMSGVTLVVRGRLR
jgi:hypothetical protein